MPPPYKKKYYETKSQFPQIFFSQDVTQSVQELQQTVSIQEKLLHSIETAKPFSNYLVALAEVIVPEVWFTDIRIAQGGQEVTLKGNSNHRANLEKLIANLLKHPLFIGANLNMNNIEETSKEDKNDNLIFELSLIKKSV